MTTTEHERPGLRPMPPPGAVNGALRPSRVYYDPAGRKRTAQRPVPVDQYGLLAGVEYHCRARNCAATKTVPMSVAAKGDPVCDNHGLRMQRIPVRAATWLPVAAARAQVAPQLKAIWVFGGAAAAGAAAHGAHIPAVALAAAAVPASLVTARILRNKLMARARAKAKLQGDGEVAKGKRREIRTKGRLVGYCVAAGCAWLAVPSVAGMDPATFGGQVSWATLAALWALPAATWWRSLRHRKATPATPQSPEPEVESEVPMDPDEVQTHRIWRSIVAARKDAIIGIRKSDGSPVKAPRAGRLADTWLEDWHKVEGGWAATIVGPDGMYTGDAFVNAAGGIASAFKMKRSMITVIPDVEDENRAEVLAQRSSSIRGVVRWWGPDSIDPDKGTAPIALLADGDLAMYEIYRPGWGSPHVFVCGTTGAGKSEAVNTLLAIDRWASYVDESGTRRGMVASFLIDPQEGQSYAPFLNDLAAPVATTLEEATLLVEAFTREMHRRNRYLAREAKTWDERRQKFRTGRKWWDPRIDGPILTLTIDEAHFFLVFRLFCQLITDGGRMWRKCGGQLRIATHTPLLTDLGGSMALRSMLTGGTVIVCRTADSLSGPTAFNGRLPVDPRTIPDEPGTCYILTAKQRKGMLARMAWEPDYYDWVRDLDDKPIGYPAPLPPDTLAAFGPEFAAWVQHAANPDAGPFIPAPAAPAVVAEPTPVALELVRLALALGAHEPDGLDMEGIDRTIRSRRVDKPPSVRTIRDALGKLRKNGEVTSAGGRHRLTDEALLAVLESLPAGAEGVGDAA